MHLVEVAFKGNRKEFYLWEGDEAPARGTAVIVDADRGEDLGQVHATGELAEQRNRGVAHGTHGEPPARRVRRIASAEDLRHAKELREQDEAARRKAIERVRANGLVMKMTDAEWQWDRRKLTFYFTAEKRVDFRALVRDLASLFRTRIELKQIGVRDEARRLDGIGRCGRQYCSASWLPELRPVNLGVAKEQRLSLNPSQISGACGRLMCCLRYEHEFYVQSRKRFPKEGRILLTARGEEKVIANDIFRELVTLRSPEGETRTIPLAAVKREIEGGSEEKLTLTMELEIPSLLDMPLDEEVIRMQDTAERPAFLLPSERPVQLGRRGPDGAVVPPSFPSPSAPEARRPAREQAPRESTPREQPRRRPGEGGNDSNGGVRGTAPAAGTPPVERRADPESDVVDIDETTPAAEGENVRSGRRRRGRRGGRRGRGARAQGGEQAAGEQPAGEQSTGEQPAGEQPDGGEDGA